jgi:hypothetical protein
MIIESENSFTTSSIGMKTNEKAECEYSKESIDKLPNLTNPMIGDKIAYKVIEVSARWV